MVIFAEPYKLMTGAVRSATKTVLFWVMAVLPELSDTSYCSVYVPNILVSTVPFTITLFVI